MGKSPRILCNSLIINDEQSSQADKQTGRQRRHKAFISIYWRAILPLKVVTVSGDTLMETVQLQTDLTCLMAVTFIFHAVRFKMQKQDLVPG